MGEKQAETDYDALQLVILDRDGVINFDSDNYIKSAAEWIPIPGSLQAIARLKQAGYKLAVATNQSGIARGYYDLETLASMHKKMQTELAKHHGKIDLIRFCPHLPEDHCHCRKPKPGMLHDILSDTGLSPQKAIFAGDSISDMLAAKAANIPFVLLKTGKGERSLLNLSEAERKQIKIFSSLQAFVNELLSTV